MDYIHHDTAEISYDIGCLDKGWKPVIVGEVYSAVASVDWNKIK